MRNGQRTYSVSATDRVLDRQAEERGRRERLAWAPARRRGFYQSRAVQHTTAVDAPEPNPDEDESTFMDRCIADPSMRNVPAEQRRAQCQQSWDDSTEDDQEDQQEPPPEPLQRSSRSLGIGQAWRAGQQMGKRYAGDPFAAARALRLSVQFVSDPSWMAILSGRPIGSTPVWGRLVGTKILVAAGQKPPEVRKTVAHEICHSLYSDASEETCELFACGFLGVAAG